MQGRLLTCSFLAAASALVLFTTGCGKDKFNINRNNNRPTDSTVTYDVILPAALHATGSLVAGDGGTSGVIQNWMSYWARSGTYAPNITEETYEITTGFGTTAWDNAYDCNYDFQVIQLKAAQAGAGFYEGIARIMKAHNFQYLVDIYGNIPYTQALKGSTNPTPAYDDGLSVYKDLLREIDKGMLLIKNAVVNNTNANKQIETNDILFQGNKQKWMRFGNTLKLRLLVHAYAVSGIDKAAEMLIINNEGSGFLQPGEDAMVQPGYQTDKPNPFYNTFIATTAGQQTATNVFFRANEWGIEYYKYNNDPRTSRFYVAGTGGLVGVAYGLPPTTANSATVLAGIGPGVGKNASAPQAILTAAEGYFLQAEARQRNIITSGASAASLLQTAIEESFRYVGAGSPAAYLAANAGYPDVDYNGTAQGPGGPVGGLFTILSQKWFALNAINPMETWTDYRRVPYTEVATNLLATAAPNDAPADHFVYGDGGGYTTFGPGPTISVAPQNVSTRIPVRFIYPQSEYNYNATNVGAQGTVTRYSRIFWDLN